MVSISTLLLMTALAAEPLGPGDHNRSLKVGELTREYIIHVPPKYDSQRATPVVLVYHGGASSAEVMIRYCGMNRKADQAGFIVVYPKGTGRMERRLTFNGGNCCGYAMMNDIDDVEFTRRILEDLAKVLNVDPKRVYATGISNGAIMVYLLASQLSDRIAAIAPVAGPMGTESCSPKRPVSVIHFHGTDDKNVPVGGGRGEGISGTNFYSVEHSLRAWIKANGCAEQPAVATIEDRAKDGTTIRRSTYGSGKDGAEVVLVEIRGGGHTWPGARIQPRYLGKATQNVSANDLMWEFFQQHPMK